MDYQRVPEMGRGLRLHLNENTAGCSRAVLDAIRGLQATDMSFYQDYAPAIDACARWLGVDADRVALVNGLDEGIWAAAASCLMGPRREAIVVEPAFDMYAASVRAIGGTVRAVPPSPDLSLPLDDVLRAIGSSTGLVYLCSPNNPTGLSIGPETTARIAEALPPGALVFLDEAYVDFGGETFLPCLERYPNVVVGRTFAKAYGLAALRAGCLVAMPQAMKTVARTIPPYSVNVCALAAMRAALADPAHRDWYCAEAAASKEMVYDACRRLGLRYWPSDANFVLVRVGDDAAAVVKALGERGFLVRDRSSEPGCAGCIRITAGVEAQTRACLAALEELLCGEA